MTPFKINYGLKENLPQEYSDGNLYLTTDEGKLYADVGGGRVQLNAVSADKLNTDAGTESKPVYFVDGSPVATTKNFLDIDLTDNDTTEYIKPQTPIKREENYIYPLTTWDQVIMPSGSRWAGIESFTDWSNTEKELVLNYILNNIPNASGVNF